VTINRPVAAKGSVRQGIGRKPPERKSVMPTVVGRVGLCVKARACGRGPGKAGCRHKAGQCAQRVRQMCVRFAQLPHAWRNQPPGPKYRCIVQRIGMAAFSAWGDQCVSTAYVIVVHVCGKLRAVACAVQRNKLRSQQWQGRSVAKWSQMWQVAV